VTFAVGETSKIINVSITELTVPEEDETLTLILTRMQGATFASGAAALRVTGVIIDDTFTSPARFLVTLDKAPTAPVSFTYYFTDGTAQGAFGDGEDFSNGSNTFTLQAGHQSGWIEVAVSGLLAVEANETFHLVMTRVSGAVFEGGAAALIATGTIIDDDGGAPTLDGEAVGAPAVQISGPPSSHVTLPTVRVHDTTVYEGDSTFTSPVRFLVTLDKAPTAPVSFAYYFTDGTAQGAFGVGEDFSDGSNTITLQAGQQSTWIEGSATALTAIEANETFFLVLTRISGAVFEGDAPAMIATATIIDDDGGPPNLNGDAIGDPAIGVEGPASAHVLLPTVRVYNTSIYEGDSTFTSPARFLIVLDKAPTAPVTFNYYTADGTAKGAFGVADYGDATGTVTLQAGQRSTWIEIPISGGTELEANETFSLILTGIRGGVFENDAAALEAKIRILDDDAGPVAIAAAAILEPSAGVESAASASAALPTLRVNDIAVHEGDSTFTSPARFLLTLDKAPTVNVTVDFHFTDKTASAGHGDFGDTTGTVTFLAGQRSASVAVPIGAGTAIEANETFNLVLTNPRGVVFENDAPALIATGTIIDTDGGPPTLNGYAIGAPGAAAFQAGSVSALPTMMVTDVAIYEGDSTSTDVARFLVTFDKVTTSNVTFTVFAQDGTASGAQGDFAEGSQSFNIPAGTRSTWVSVNTSQGTAIEPNETFKLVFSNLTGAAFTGDAPALVATATMIDTDGGPPTLDGGIGFPAREVAAPADSNINFPTLRIVPTSIAEGDTGTSVVGIYLIFSRPLASNVTFTAQTLAGTATSGADFFAVNSNFNVPAGTRSTFVQISIGSDALIEGDEAFQVNFSALSGAVFEGGGANKSVTVTIRDNDGGGVLPESGPAFILAPGPTPGNDTIVGTPGNDPLFGAASNDTISGLAGNDRIDGGLGRDTMDGGLGDDLYFVDNGLDVTNEPLNGGTDHVISSVRWTLATNFENLTLTGAGNFNGTGNNLANVIIGNDGVNVLDGKGGNDTLRGGGFDTLIGGLRDDAMFGGVGNDTYVVDAAGDVVTEVFNEGVDMVRTSVTCTLGANVENATVIGAAAVDVTGNALVNVMVGNNAANTLLGLDGNDNLAGLGGDDILRGGAGRDRLNGGAGADAFVFDTVPLNVTKTDLISDFNPTDDTIWLDGAIYAALGAPGALAANIFRVVTSGFAAGDADDRIIYNQNNGALWYDADGTGAAFAVYFAQITPGTVLTEADFLVI
jgi:Ca2+-binding RTX toxin-like protein/predicted heme/steroid binding protein